jgi:glycosyltransferase involved in cell wall biosynthesis
MSLIKDITILIPVYNREKYISYTIESCFQQTYKNFKILIYDDCSTDNTLSIIESFVNKYGKETIECIKGNINLGIGGARNILLQNLKTKYGTWLDSDDLMDPKRLETCFNYLENNKNIDIVYSYIRRFKSGENINIESDENIITIDTEKYDANDYNSLKSNTTCATAFFKSFLKKYEIESSLRYGSEDVLWLWRLLNNNINISQIDKPLYLYRNHNDRLSILKKERIEEKAKENIIIHEKIIKYLNG